MGLGFSRGMLLRTSCSSFALIAFASPAWANCDPNPAQGATTATCQGSETRGLVIGGDQVVVNVKSGATVSGPVAAIRVAPASSSSYYQDRSTITIEAGATVSGTVGIDVSGPGYYNQPLVSLSNAGTIRGTGGIALRADDNAIGRFASITNASTGVIGAIRGQVGSLVNEGLIDGGAITAYADARNAYYYGQGPIENKGTIRSNSAGATIDLVSSYISSGSNVINSGVIENLGSGAAILGLSQLSLTNAAGGTIDGGLVAITASYISLSNLGTIRADDTAVQADNYINLLNKGTIVGDVRATPAQQGGGSTIDNRGGTIDGDLVLGRNDDVLVGDADNLAKPIGTITGLFDAGGGNDVLRFTFGKDTVLDTAISLPATIERLGLRVEKSATLTVAKSVALTSVVVLGGGDRTSYELKNRFILNGSITTQGPAILADPYASSGFDLTNTGTISAQLAVPGDFAVNLPYYSVDKVINSGTITATGGGGLSLGNATTFNNSGTITADGNAVYVRYSQTENSGTIRSTGDVGLYLDNVYQISALNTGTVEGAVAGARVVSSTLRNSGTISGTQTGVEVQGGTLDNLAGGVITGGTRAVGPSTLLSYSSGGGGRVFNAGTINGNVELGKTGPYYPSSNVFVALAGGVVNGNIDLGSGGDIFATSLVNTGPGEFAGITGRVTGSGQETLRYLITADTSTTVVRKGIFSGLAYDLSGNATLTLTSPVALDYGLGFSGKGKVDLTADIVGRTDMRLLDLHQTSLQRDAQGATLPTAIDLTSRGTITVTQGQVSSTPAYGIALAGGDRFTNAGTIIAAAAAPDPNIYYSNFPYALISIAGNTTVTNTGTIRMGGGIGIQGSAYSNDGSIVTNSGVIEQLAGGVAATGIANVSKVINSGTIRMAGAAISFAGQGSVVNSGTLSSSGGAALQGTNIYSSAQVDNQRGGTITGGVGGVAINLSGGSIVQNSGTIEGNVALNYNPYIYASNTSPSVYVNRGGQLNGNLVLGDGDDIVVAQDGLTGVTGTITTGLGTDTFVRGYTASATANLDDLAGDRSIVFERSGLAAYGANTTITLTGQSRYAGPLLLAGDGAFVNLATIDTAAGIPPGQAGRLLQLGSSLDPTNAFGIGSTLSFTNKGSLANGVTGYARLFDNQGVIAVAEIYGTAVALQANDPTGLTFRNSGTITGQMQITQDASVARVAQSTFDNSGTINSALSIDARAARFTFSNSGRIDNPGDSYRPIFVNVGQSFNYAVALNAEEASFVNSGTIVPGLQAALSAKRVSFVNSGTIADKAGLSLYQAGLSTPVQGSYNPLISDQESMTLTNTGTIGGGVELSARAPLLTIDNRGTMASLSADATSQADQAIGLTNSGTIESKTIGISAVNLSSAIVASDGTTSGTGKAAITLTNTGTIRADSGAAYYPTWSQYPYVYTGPLLDRTQAIAIGASDTAASDVVITNAAGATISAASGVTGVPNYIYGVDQAPAPVPAGYAEVSSVAIDVVADRFTLDNAGTIRGAAGGILPRPTVLSNTSYFLPTLSTGYLAGAIQTYASIDTITNRAGGLIVGSIDLGEKNDTLANAGRIEGDVYMGAGDDLVQIGTGGVFTGTVSGGDGTDRIELATTSAYPAATEVTGDRFVGFERLVNTSGANALSGTLALDVDVNGGYLFGRAGSVLVGNVQVASGARFGSAGTVTGNVTVAQGGQLAPGASPGTMTVNGNVSLASGSTTIFELAPSGASDRLIVNGTLAIASGATLNLTGDRPLAPGVSYDLFSATTLTGSFGTVTQSGAIQGVVRNTSGRIALVATVAGPTVGVPQAGDTVGYVNALIAAGEASPTLVAALPQLLGADGRANAQAFARLSGEAYASALQLGVEHGLAVVQAGRSGFAAPQGERNGAFAFAQGLGSWRTLAADGARGTARVTSSSGGVLGGLGLAHDGSSLGAFVGYVDGRQSLSGRDARSELDGVTLGVAGQLVAGAFSASALFAYDWGNASTHRGLAGGNAGARYRLRTGTIDLSAGYDAALGKSWVLRPHAGFTHVWTRSGAAVETGNAPFGLAVDGGQLNASFVDGGLALRATGTAPIQPWIDLGVRHQIDGRRGLANARFLGETAGFASVGAPRQATQVVTAAGFAARANERLTLFGSFTGEFGGGGNGQNLTAGLRYTF